MEFADSEESPWVLREGWLSHKSNQLLTWRLLLENRSVRTFAATPLAMPASRSAVARVTIAVS